MTMLPANTALILIDVQQVGGRGLLLALMADYAIPPEAARDLLNALNAAAAG